MDKVKIKDIAEELGIRSKDVLQKAVLMAIDVKSIRSSISVEDAQKIFDVILYNKEVDKTDISMKDTLFFTSKNFKLYICENSTDINFLKNISVPYTNQNIDNFLLLSYNYSDTTLQELYSLSLHKLDIEKYLQNRFSDDDSYHLQESIKKFCYDFDVSRIDADMPLENIKEYSRKFKPQLIFIEGIDFKYLAKNDFEILKTIKQMTLFNISFELGVVNSNTTKKDKLKQQVSKYFEPSKKRV